MGAGEKDKTGERAEGKAPDLHFKIFLPLPDSFCSISQPLHPSLFFFFSLPSVSASLLVVTDASSLLFVLAFFNVLFLVFVSGQCLCPCEFPASNLHLHDAQSSMFPPSEQRARLIARSSPLVNLHTLT